MEVAVGYGWQSRWLGFWALESLDKRGRDMCERNN